MKTTVIAPSTTRIRTNERAASWNASRLRSLLEQLVKTGHERRAAAPSRRTARARRFGTWKAIVNAENAPHVPK